MKTLILLLLLSPLLMLNDLLALEGTLENGLELKAEDQQSLWDGDVQFGYIMSSGNTETASLNGKFNIKYSTVNWRHLFSAEAFSSSEKEKTTAERYKIDYQADKKFADKNYFFSNINYEADRFSGYDYRSTVTAGYGSEFYNKDNTTLVTEIGAGYRHSRLGEEAVISDQSAFENEAMLRFAAKYFWQIEDNRSLMADLKIDAGEQSIITNFELGFMTMIAGALSLKVTYVARYTTNVPLDKENLDTVTSINLLYAF